MKNTEIFFKFIKNDDKKIEKIAPGITGYRPNIYSGLVCQNNFGGIKKLILPG